MKNLTARYSATQFTYWAASSGAASFATTYLLNKGLSSGIVGTLLAVAGLLSCLTQPILASIADKSKQFILTKLLLIMSALCCICFSVQLIPQFPLILIGVFYMIGIWSSDAMLPLVNALSVAYQEAGFPINYGASRGIGSAATALSSLALGFLIAQYGTTWMIVFLLAFRVACMVVIAGYPKIQKATTLAQEKKESCSIPYFFSSYSKYCISLLGILFLGMFHAMTENYLIAIMSNLGGDSSNVGTALFISAMVGAPVIFCFSHIRKWFQDNSLLKIAAVSFLLKAVLFYFAQSISTIYLIELLQITSYALLAPVQVYYANASVRSCDMVKGQAFITAAYALGCSAGNFAGGILLTFGIKVVLIAGIIMAAIGTVIIFSTVSKDAPRK